MKQTVQRFFFGRYFLIPAGLLLLYTLLGFLVAPIALRWYLPRFSQAHLNSRAEIGEVKINPFLLTLEAREFSLKGPDDALLADFGRLFFRLRLDGLFEKTVKFGELSLENPNVHAVIGRDGALNFARLVPEPSEKPVVDAAKSPPSDPVRMILESFAVTNGRITITDQRQSPPVAVAISDISLDLKSLSTIRDKNGTYSLSAKTSEGESVQWRGEISLIPFRSKGTLACSGIQAKTAWGFLRDTLNLDAPTGTFNFSTDYIIDSSDPSLRLSLENSRMDLAGFSLRLAGTEEFFLEVNKLDVESAKFDLTSRSVSIGKILLDGGKVRLHIDDTGRMNVERIVRNPGQEPKEQAVIPAAAEGPRVQTTDGAWKVDIDSVGIKNIALGVENLTPAAPSSADIASFSISSKVRIETGPNSRVQLAELHSELADLRLESKQASAPLSARIAGISIKVNANIETGPNFRAQLSEISSELAGLRLESKRASAPLSADISGISIKVKAQIEAGESLQAQIGETHVELAGLQLRDKQGSSPVFDAQRLIFEDCGLDLAQRRVTVSRVQLNTVHLDAGLEQDGRLNLERIFAGKQPDAKITAVAETRSAPGGDWKFLVKAFELKDFRSAISDYSVSQKPLYSIKGLNAKVTDIDGKSAMPFEMSLGVEQGGKMSFQGKIDPLTPSAEVKVSVGDLVLTPLAPYLAPHITLTPQSAAVSTEGVFRYGIPKSGAKLTYEGMLSVDRLNLTQPGSKETYLGWGSMRFSKLKMALEPNSLRVEEVRLSKPLGELIIAEDGTVNLTKIVKEQPAGKPRPGTSGASSGQRVRKPGQARTQQAKGGDAFPFKIDTVRVEEGNIVFADLTLFPKFMTRIHDLKGTITNLSSEKGGLSKIQLAGGVDRYGSAKAEGTLDLSDYKRSTELNIVFRNVEMASMTPYSGKFAGRKIKSGKLSTDLKYTIKDNKLAGDNKIIVDNLVLGERVESPHATNLPLDLAIALLSDSNGRIDLGLPVSGDLNDPQFSIGPLVWKAITALLTKTVTAPFRALAGLFGGGEQKFDSVQFDPGKAELMPPEKEKLKKVADGLKSKSQLMVVVQGRFSPEVDGSELKEMNLRRHVAGKLGIQTPPGTDPAPLDLGDSKVLHILEKLYSDRSGEKALDELTRAVEKGEIAPREGSAEARERGKNKKRGFLTRAVSAVKVHKIVPGMRSPEKSELLAGELYFRLIETGSLPETDLLELATQRGQAISNELQGAGQLQNNRVQAAAPEPLSGDEGVSAKLSLEPQAASASEPPVN